MLESWEKMMVTPVYVIISSTNSMIFIEISLVVREQFRKIQSRFSVMDMMISDDSIYH